MYTRVPDSLKQVTSDILNDPRQKKVKIEPKLEPIAVQNREPTSRFQPRLVPVNWHCHHSQFQHSEIDHFCLYIQHLYLLVHFLKYNFLKIQFSKSLRHLPPFFEVLNLQEVYIITSGFALGDYVNFLQVSKPRRNSETVSNLHLISPPDTVKQVLDLAISLNRPKS